MPRPTARPDGATRAQLLGAAEIAFAERGFESTRLSDVAKEAGIRRPSLLYHFPTKLDLYCAVVRSTFEDLGAALTGPLEAPGLLFDARLEALLGAFGSFLDARPAAARIVLRELLDGLGPGRDILLEVAVPLLDRVEGSVAEDGAGHLRPGVPLRTVLLSVIVTRFVRAAAAEPLASALFPPTDDTWAFLKSALLR